MERINSKHYEHLKNIDWKLYLERKSTIFYVSIFLIAYKDLLKKITGFQFDQQLLWYEKGFLAYYRSGKQIQEAQKYFVKIMKEHPEKIAAWDKQGKQYLKKEQELIEQFAKEITTKQIVREYQEIMKECQSLFLYLTSIPFLILGAIEASPETKEFEEIRKIFQEYRKSSRTRLQEHVFERIWKAAAEIIEWKDPMDFSFLTFQELRNLFEKKRVPDKAEIEQRKKGCALYLGYDGLTFYYDKDFLAELGIKQEKIEEVKEIKGKVACKGKAKGRVCILNRVGDMAKFKDGDIVVSINTTPGLMPALMKCKAIVADEGGLISHAAIVSRELNKPCIIGTKIATKILKDGDLVEVDAENGIVRKIP